MNFKLIECNMDSAGSFTLELLDQHGVALFADVLATFFDNPPFFGVDQVTLEFANADVQAWLDAHKPLVHAAILEQFELNAANEHTLCGGWQ